MNEPQETIEIRMRLARAGYNIRKAASGDLYYISHPQQPGDVYTLRNQQQHWICHPVLGSTEKAADEILAIALGQPEK